MIRGTLTATVPVPVRDASGEAPRTFFARTEPYQRWAWGVAILCLAGRAYRRGRGSREPRGDGSRPEPAA